MPPIKLNVGDYSAEHLAAFNKCSTLDNPNIDVDNIYLDLGNTFKNVLSLLEKQQIEINNLTNKIISLERQVINK